MGGRGGSIRGRNCKGGQPHLYSCNKEINNPFGSLKCHGDSFSEKIDHDKKGKCCETFSHPRFMCCWYMQNLKFKQITGDFHCKQEELGCQPKC
jgi:hypothetical protein